MVIDNRVVRWVIVSLLVLLVIPLLAMLGMMLFGGPMMTQMGGMMSGGVVALCVLWTVLVSAALIFLIVFLARGDPAERDRAIPTNLRSPAH